MTKVSKKKRNFRHDCQELSAILGKIARTRDIIKRYKCDFSQSNTGLCHNLDAFELCVFQMAQIGERVNLLTDSSREDIESVINIKILIYFRNMIDHDYDRVNKVILQTYIQQTISDKTINKIKDRLKFCKNNCREERHD